MSTTRDGDSRDGDDADSRRVWFAAQSAKVHTDRDCHAFRDTAPEDIIETTEADAAQAMHDKGRMSPGPLGPSICHRCQWDLR